MRMDSMINSLPSLSQVDRPLRQSWSSPRETARLQVKGFGQRVEKVMAGSQGGLQGCSEPSPQRSTGIIYWSGKPRFINPIGPHFDSLHNVSEVEAYTMVFIKFCNLDPSYFREMFLFSFCQYHILFWTVEKVNISLFCVFTVYRYFQLCLNHR